MPDRPRVAIILPAYNAARTLQATVAAIPPGIADDIILTDDASTDGTANLADQLGLHTIRHAKNQGYGANQKTCYAAAIARGADIIVMLHPDGQYAPALIPNLVALLATKRHDAAIASRMLGGGAIAGGMPRAKYLANRALTATQNLLMHAKLSEFHTGYRAWTRRVLQTLPLHRCADGFLFDNQMLALALHAGFRIGEIACPTRYFPEASSIGPRDSIAYAAGVLGVTASHLLHRAGLRESPLFAGVKQQESASF